MKSIWTDPFYSREHLEQLYTKMTDNQWLILQTEVNDAGDDEDLDEIIQDVCLNLESYEAEYADWNASRKPK